jgi:hypothetical protein
MKRSAELGLHIVMAEPDSAENAITDLLQLAAETRLAGLILTPPIGDAPGLIDALLDADMKLAVVARRRRASRSRKCAWMTSARPMRLRNC